MFSRFTTTIFTLVIFVVTTEIIFRANGYKPAGGGNANEPLLTKPDPILGWRMKPGMYNYPAYAKDYPNVQVTILADGQRATSSNPNNTSKDVIFLIGCSLTLGYAVSDQDTFAWKLQAKYPELQFNNYGVIGYSTYQSLLRLEQDLLKIKKPKIIIYSFFNHHELRNVAPHAWLNNPQPMPFANLDTNNNLAFYMTPQFSPAPLRKKLASVEFLEHLYKKRFQSRLQNLANMQPVTELLIKKMHALSVKHGAKFYMVILDAQPEITWHYSQVLNPLGIEVIDCVDPNNAILRVPGENHPNGQLHSNWATCISKNINFLQS